LLGGPQNGIVTYWRKEELKIQHDDENFKRFITRKYKKEEKIGGTKHISFNIIVTFHQYFSFSILVMWLHWQSSKRILGYIWLHSKYESRKKFKHPIMLYAILVIFGKFFRIFFVLTNF
jgi:hypothetical protein